MKINVKNNNVMKAYNILRNKLEKDGLFRTLSEKKYYVSKSQKNRLKQKEAIKRTNKERVKKQIELNKQDEQHYKSIRQKSYKK